VSAAVAVRRLGRRLLPPRVRRALRPARTAPPPSKAAAAPGPAEGTPPHREALVRMLERGEPLDRAIALGLATAVASVETAKAGAIDPSRVEELAW
jgi:hypothetical protein